MNLGQLYHWSPADRHDLIRKEGLRPGCDSVVASSPLHYLCFGVCPQRAWAISGSMPWVAEIDQWDLWLIHVADHDELHVRPTYGPQVEEVRVRGTVPPDRLWWIGRRHAIGLPV